MPVPEWLKDLRLAESPPIDYEALNAAFAQDRKPKTLDEYTALGPDFFTYADPIHVSHALHALLLERQTRKAE